MSEIKSKSKSKSKSAPTMAQVAERERAAKAKRLETEAGKGKRKADTIVSRESATFATLAGDYFTLGGIVRVAIDDGLVRGARGFATAAEHGGTLPDGAAQPDRLTTYRRALVIFDTCAALAVAPAELAETYLADVRATGKAPSLDGLVNYCARGMSLDAPARKSGERTFDPTAAAARWIATHDADQAKAFAAALLAAVGAVVAAAAAAA